MSNKALSRGPDAVHRNLVISGPRDLIRILIEHLELGRRLGDFLVSNPMCRATKRLRCSGPKKRP